MYPAGGLIAAGLDSVSKWRRNRAITIIISRRGRLTIAVIFHGRVLGVTTRCPRPFLLPDRFSVYATPHTPLFASYATGFVIFRGVHVRATAIRLGSRGSSRSGGFFLGTLSPTFATLLASKKVFIVALRPLLDLPSCTALLFLFTNPAFFLLPCFGAPTLFTTGFPFCFFFLFPRPPFPSLSSPGLASLVYFSVSHWGSVRVSITVRTLPTGAMNLAIISSEPFGTLVFVCRVSLVTSTRVIALILARSTVLCGSRACT
jgi:hypothetical protein